MAIPELDLKKVNLQAAVGYLISLHDNEVEWNLLGIKVIGVVPTAEDIPAGSYEYGDAYEDGTEPPYDMYIYTRPDGNVHTEGYWFPVGKFPMPGPQGPKGDGLEKIMSGGYGNIQSVQYDKAYGARVNGDAIINYVDSTTGMPTSKSFPMASEMPIVPGKYIDIGTNSDKNALTVKVDDTALALDYYKMDKSQTTSTIPYWDGTKAGTLKATSDNVANSVAQRNANGDCSFDKVYTSALRTLSGSLTVGTESIYVAVENPNGFVEKTSTDTGVFTDFDLANITFYKTRQIQYDNKIYYYMDPKSAPNGTLNFIHLDSIDDGNGGHKATGKCFNINVNTKAWQVFDLDFGGKVYQHEIHFEVTGAGTSSNANVWDIELVITTSSPNKITKNTLYKYISTSNYPLQVGTPISVYRARVQDPAGLGIGRMAVQHEVGEISNTDHYIFELRSMDGISETITERDQNQLNSFVDTVTEV